MIQVTVHSGLQAGQWLTFDEDVVTVGRASDNHVILADSHVSGHHLRIVRGPHRTLIEDLHSTRGTTVIMGDERKRLDEMPNRCVEVDTGCRIEVGTGAELTLIEVRLLESDEARVVSMRRIEEIGVSGENLERDLQILPQLYAAQKRLDAASDLDEVLEATCDGVLQLLPRATHVTVTLRDEEDSSQEPVYVPVVTRERGTDGSGAASRGAIPIARSVFRKVLSERAAVLAADAP
ncbi:MAG TPA: FHA domain-containing protein, partial [Polyangiaceae bacterium]|nr:FHA domain-containing protein [Polyangiaceae bacterium]